MTSIDIREALMWGGVIALVILVTFTGMCINRYFTYRAHRRALAELRSRASMALRGTADAQSMERSMSRVRSGGMEPM